MILSRSARFVLAMVTAVVTVAHTGASASIMFEAVERQTNHASVTCPLTGKKTKRAKATRPAVAIKVDNSGEAEAQHGLRAADLVIESLVEGGMTRLTAVYHCGSAASVGPVRSGRYDDGESVEPFTTFLAISGSNASVAANLALWGVVTADESSTGMHRDEELDAPYNLFAETEALRSLASENLVEAPAGMTFGSLPPGAAKTSVVELTFSDEVGVGYRWTRKGWARSQNGSPSVSDDRRVYAQNVLVQVVDVTASQTLVDVNGAPSPLMSLTGKGKAYLFRNGRALSGTWSDDGDGAPVFKTKKGKRFAFAPGKTWLELVPSDAGDLTGKVAFR